LSIEHLEEGVEDLRLYVSSNVKQKPISHLPIAPPIWCRISSDDKDLLQVPFSAGRNLPSTFSLDESSRCSCGLTDNNHLLLPVETLSVIVFTSFTAIEKLVETRYCSSCRNTRGRAGPDMGKHGVFNWNNRHCLFARTFRFVHVAIYQVGNAILRLPSDHYGHVRVREISTSTLRPTHVCHSILCVCSITTNRDSDGMSTMRAQSSNCHCRWHQTRFL
jgi:CxC4 like cysteine cluster associated with KDZ transposases